MTAAVPVHPEAVQSWREYADLIDVFRVRLESDLAARCVAELHLNTKDRAERGYLAPFGTALGKGDCGVVGRGNRTYGVIEPLRPAGCEAPAGKNPLHHGGKIYSTLACRAAQALEAKSGSPAEVTIVARNGEPLEEPAFLHLALCAGADRAAAEEIVRETLAGAREFVSDFLAVDPVDRFRTEAQ